MANFIWEMPSVRGGIQFDDCMVSFLLDIACLVLGLVLCFGGRKALGSCVVTAVGLVCGWGGVLISRYFPTNLVIKLVFFAMFCFLGLCLAFFLDTLWKAAARKTGAFGWLGDRVYWLTAFLGAGLAACTLWTKIYRSGTIAAAVFGVLSVLGLVWQLTHKRRQKVTYTYDDLYKMKREDKRNA